ncbi:MFS transporter [Yinghuangia aomiensis]|uniref:MFS transporter n=1 Tax=Yinghuangia aomiensis TaxID=676205 RepID=A0ABP9I1T9_9ACTN
MPASDPPGTASALSASAPTASRSRVPTDKPSADPTPPRPSLVLAVVTGVMLLIGIDATVVNLALPDMTRAVHLSPTAGAWVLNAYTLAFGGLLLLGGRLGDVFGRRRAFLTGIALFTAASLLAGCAPWAWWLITARVVQGIGGALAGPSTMALILTTFPGPARARALAWYSAVLGGGATAGLILGGVLTDLASWRWVFLVNVPLGILLTATAVRVLPDPARQHSTPGRLDIAGAITGTLAATAFVYACLRAASDGWSDPATLVALGTAALTAPAFLAVERRAPQPLMPLRLAFRGPLARALPVIALLAAAVFGTLFFLGRYLQEVRGYSPVASGLLLVPMLAAQFAAARLSPILSRRFGPTRLIVSGAAGVAAGLGGFTLLGPHDGYAAGLLWPMVLLGLGIGMSMPTLNTYALAAVSPADSGAASGLLQTSQWQGGGVGLAAWVTVYGTETRGGGTMTSGIATALGAAGICAAVGCLLAIVLLRRGTRDVP